jgi:hypothetical protein
LIAPYFDHLVGALRAVAGALQHAKINAERAHSVAVLMGQNSRDLVQMS